MSFLPKKSVVCPVLVGRAAQVETLARLIERARSREGGLVLISGEAGVGKSRLAKETVARAAAHSFLCLTGRCFETDRAIPYAPLLDLLQAFCAPRPKDEIAAALGPSPELLKLLPELTPLFPGLAPPPPLEPEQERRRLFQTLTQFFTRLAASQPLLVVVEDIHWGDDASLEFLLYLARRLTSQPLLLLLTCRSDETAPALNHLLSALDRERLVTELRLHRFTVREVDEMLRAIFELQRPVRAEFLEALYELTEGNPFFIEEILKDLVASGEIFYSDGSWDRKPLNELYTLRVRTVQVAVQQRLDQLDPIARQVLTLAAVVGRRFDFALLQQLTQQTEADLVGWIKELRTAQLVVEESADVFAFRHALTRQAVYADLLARERKALHRTVAETMERAGAYTHANLAFHFYEAGEWAKAMDYSIRAGEQAQALYSPRTALVHFSRALEAARQAPSPTPPPLLLSGATATGEGRGVGAIYRARGQAYEILGDFESARADYESAFALARADGDARAEWQALLDLGALWASRDYVRTGGYFRQALSAARTLNDPETLARTLNRLGNWHMNVEQFSEALQCQQEALALFQTLDDRRGLAETLDLLGMTTAMGGDPLQGVSYYEQALALFQELDDRGGMAAVLTVLGPRGAIYFLNTAIWPESDFATRLRQTELAVQMARETGSRPAEALASAWLGLCLATAGEYGRALELAEQAVVIAEEIGHRQFEAILHWVVGAIYLDLLAATNAIAHLEVSLRRARESEAIHWVRTASSFLASAYLLNDDVAQAESILAGALAPNMPMRANGQRLAWAARAELLLAQGKSDEALQLVERLITSAPNIETRGEHAIPRLGLLRGEALVALGQTATAEVVLKGAAETALAQDVPSTIWRIHAALSWLYRGQRRYEEAEQAGAAARRVIEELSAKLPDATLRENFVGQATARLPSASPRRAAKQAFEGLTSREREVAARVALGKSNRAIAEELVVSERTVEKHVENILSKLGFTSRAQVAAWAVKRDLASGQARQPRDRGAGGQE